MRKLIFELLTTAGFCCTTVFAAISLGSFAASSLANDAMEPIYKDPAQPIEARVEDLLKRMSLEEKVAQLQTVWEQRQALETDEGVFSDAHAARILGLGIGQVARPTENKAPLSPNKSPEKTVAFVNAVQKWLLENTRWAIPAIFHEEALHGHAAPGATSFPQAIALASTWDPALVQEVYSITAAEVRRRGAQQALTPILDVARDPRWGRFEETMGEDPYLVAAMGVAAVRGFQGDGPGIPKDKVIATLKHLAGHGEPRGGLNIAPTPVGDRELREVFLFPFEAAVKVAGARSVMASYNEIDGIPSHSNKTLLQDILRNEWHFDGVVVSDYFAIRELLSRHHITDSKAGAAKIALEAGVDVEMPDGDAYRHLVELVKSGQVTIDTVDTVVKRILHEKFMLGLFEDPYVEPRGVEEFVGREEHRGVAQRAAEKAMVLLKNDDDLLPFDASEIGSIAVIGPHADDYAINVHFDDLNDSYWFSEELLELLFGRLRKDDIIKRRWRPVKAEQAVSLAERQLGRTETAVSRDADRVRIGAGHVHGATKFFRRACWEQISPVPPILGWDTIDESTARMRGWRTQSFAMPDGDPERNETQAREALLSRGGGGPARSHPKPADTGPGAGAAAGRAALDRWRPGVPAAGAGARGGDGGEGARRLREHGGGADRGHRRGHPQPGTAGGYASVLCQDVRAEWVDAYLPRTLRRSCPSCARARSHHLPWLRRLPCSPGRLSDCWWPRC